MPLFNNILQAGGWATEGSQFCVLSVYRLTEEGGGHKVFILPDNPLDMREKWFTSNSHTSHFPKVLGKLNKNGKCSHVSEEVFKIYQKARL